MKVRSLLFSMLCMLVLSVSFTSCSDNDNETRDDTGSKVTLPQARAFFLYEGSYQANNSGISFMRLIMMRNLLVISSRLRIMPN